MAHPRIASLVPSGTDIVAEMGLGDHLVGVSHSCDHPVARGRPVLTSSAVPAGVGQPGGPSSGDVDRAVAEALRTGQPLYRVDLGLLHRLRPDVVITQDLCQVCAVSGDQVLGRLPAGCELVTLEATTLSGLEADLERVGKATAAEERARSLARQLRTTLSGVAQLVRQQPRRRVVVLEWEDPPYLGGHWVPELVDVAGGTHLLCHAGQASARTTWEAVAEAGPDVVVYAPCGLTLAQAEVGVRGWRHRLSPQVQVWATDATSLFSRCTPAAARAAVQVLAGILHSGRAPAPDPASARPVS